MKVTPIAGPGQGVADVGLGQTSSDRKSAAKAAFMGEEAPQQEQKQTELQPPSSIKRIQMRTNVSPDRPIAPELMAETEPESIQTPTHETVEPEVTRPISPQFAALAKQRRALLVKEQELAKKERALAEQAQSPGSAIDLARLKSQPLAALKEAGVSYEQLTEEILAEQSGVTPEVRALREEVESLKKGFDEKFSERDQQQERQVLTEMRREADRLVADKPDDFEMIRGTRSQPKIIDLIHRTWKSSGEVLDVSEAAQLIEDQLVEDSLKMANFGKVRSRLTPGQQVQAQATQRQQGIRTLTNRDTATRPQSTRDRAIAAFFGTLKR